MRFRETICYWTRLLGEGWPGTTIASALAEKFIAEVDVVDPLGLAELHGRPILFLANHQVFLESVLFNVVVPPLVGRATVALAKTEHRQRWLGRLLDILYALPGGAAVPPAVEYFDRENPDEILGVIERLARHVADGGENVLVHVEGTRRRSCRRGRVQAMSPLWTEVAVMRDWPIVPVRFVGGLPVEDTGKKLDAPFGFARQTIRLGAPIAPAELRKLGDEARVRRVRGAINELSDNRTEQPGTPDPDFAAEVEERLARTGGDPMAAVIFVALRWFHRAGGAVDPVCAAILEQGDAGGTPAARALARFFAGERDDQARLLQAS